MSSSEELALKVKAWLDQNAFVAKETHIMAETDLVAAGLLDSVRFLDLLLFLENETGRKFDFEDVDEFTTVRGLWSALQSDETGTSASSAMIIAR